MRRASCLFIVGLFLAFGLSFPGFAGTVIPTWTFGDYGLHTYGPKTVIITPLRAVGANGNLIALGDPLRGVTTNSAFSTNLLNGAYYRVEIWSGYNLYALTNFFDANTTGAVDGGDPLYRAFGQPQDRTVFAPSLPYAMAIFMLKVSGVATNPAFFGTVKLPASGSIGDVWTQTNADGTGTWLPPTGGGGGGGGGDQPPSLNLTNWSKWDTNAYANVVSNRTVSALGSAAFTLSSAYDGAGTGLATATAATNGMGITSGQLLAFRNTNSFLFTNNPTAGGTLNVTNGVSQTGVSLSDSGNVKASGDVAAATMHVTGALSGGTLQMDNNNIHSDGSGNLQSLTLQLNGSTDQGAAVSVLGVTSAGKLTTSSVPGGGNVTGTGSSTSGNLAQISDSTATHIIDSGKKVTDFDQSGAALAAATAATNGLPGAAFKGTNAFDLAGTAIAVTNGYPFGPLYTGTNDLRNITFGGTHTNLGGVILPAGNPANTNAAASITNVAVMILSNTVDLGVIATATSTNLLGIGSVTNLVQVVMGTNLTMVNIGPGTNRLDAAGGGASTNLATATTAGLVKGGSTSVGIGADGTLYSTNTSAVFTATNVIASTTNELLLDLANYNVFKIYGLTNFQWKLTNSASLTQKAYIYYQQDTNGGRVLNAYSVAGGLVQTNANMQPTTNGSALDVLELLPGFFPTNILAYWPQNFQPRVGFTNSTSTGGGGGGGGSWTHVASISTNANLTAHAIVTTPPIDTTAGNLIIYSLAIYQGTPLVYDSLGNTYTQLGVYGDTGNAFSNTLAYAIAPTTGAAQTFTVTNNTAGTEYTVINVDVWSRSGGSPTLDTASGFSRTTGNTTTYQSGSITTAHNGELIVSGFTWNSATVTASSVDSSLTIRGQQPRGSDPISGGIASGTQTTAGAINPAWTWTGNLNQLGGSTAGWY